MQDFSNTSVKEIPFNEFYEMLKGKYKEEVNKVSKVYWFEDCRVMELQTRDGYKYLRQEYKGNGK